MEFCRFSPNHLHVALIPLLLRVPGHGLLQQLSGLSTTTKKIMLGHFIKFSQIKAKQIQHVIHVNSFCNISYCSNSEYWSQKPTQSGNIYSTILDVYDGQQRVSSRELKTFLLSKTLTKWLEFLMASEIQKNSSGFELQVQILNVWYSDRYCNCFKIHRYTRTRSRLI